MHNFITLIVAGFTSLVVAMCVGCATNVNQPTVYTLNTSPISCAENHSMENGQQQFKLDCDMPFKTDPVQFRGYVERRAAQLCGPKRKHEVIEYKEMWGIPLCGDETPIRSVRATIWCV